MTVAQNRLWVPKQNKENNWGPGEVSVCKWGFGYTYSLASSTERELGNSMTPMAMNTSTAQILVSKYHPLLKETRDPWRND